VQHDNCNECTKSKTCVWCETKGECMAGNVYGPSAGGIFKDTCKDFRWGQCKVNGRILFWGTLAGLIATVLIFGVAVLCCCCCMCRRKRQQAAEEREMDEIELLYEERRRAREHKTKTSQKRAEFYQKYGRPQPPQDDTLVNV